MGWQVSISPIAPLFSNTNFQFLFARSCHLCSSLREAFGLGWQKSHPLPRNHGLPRAWNIFVEIGIIINLLDPYRLVLHYVVRHRVWYG